MLLASGLIWLNTTWLFVNEHDSLDDDMSPIHIRVKCKGWPMYYEARPSYHFMRWDIIPLIVDILVALAILVLTGFVVERTLYRKSNGIEPNSGQMQ